MGTVIHEPELPAERRQALYAEVAAEKHPAFCAGDPTGCDGVHISKAISLSATDKDGTLPLHIFAKCIDADGSRSVEILFEFDAAPVSVDLTEAQARAFAAALTEQTDTFAGPSSTWSWPLEKVVAYGEALLAGGAR